VSEAWTAAEIAAMDRRDKRRVWLFEVRLGSAVWRAAQTSRDVRDHAGRVWSAVGANGELQGLGTGIGRRPREAVAILHGIQSGQSVYARLEAADPVGAPVRIFMAWVEAEGETLIVQPKLRFAGVVAARPSVRLAQTDRVTLRLLSGSARFAGSAAPWDATPASHRAYAGVDDPIYDDVTDQTQLPAPV